MSSSFSRSLSLLRQERGISQRAAARDLSISQALLSHYENGIREPGLAFVARVCDYYNVSADFLLGRTLARDGTIILDADTLNDPSDKRDDVLRGSVMATLAKKLLLNSTSLIFDLLGKMGNKAAIKAASEYLSTALYKIYRDLFRAAPGNNEDFFSVPPRQYAAGLPNADMICSELEFVEALSAYAKEKGEFPVMSHDILSEEYPAQYQSLLQVVHSTNERITRRTAAVGNAK